MPREVRIDFLVPELSKDKKSRNIATNAFFGIEISIRSYLLDNEAAHTMADKY